jgi:hypothetical protein
MLASPFRSVPVAGTVRQLDAEQFGLAKGEAGCLLTDGRPTATTAAFHPD